MNTSLPMVIVTASVPRLAVHWPAMPTLLLVTSRSFGHRAWPSATYSGTEPDDQPARPPGCWRCAAWSLPAGGLVTVQTPVVTATTTIMGAYTLIAPIAGDYYADFEPVARLLPTLRAQGSNELVTTDLIPSQGSPGGAYAVTLAYHLAYQPPLRTLHFWLSEQEVTGQQRYYGPIQIANPGAPPLYLPSIVGEK